MSTRQIKDAKDLATGEKIYLKGHAKATYLSDGRNVDDAITKLREDFDTLVDGDTTNAIETFNEIIAFLEGISDSENLDSIIASIEQQIAGKQGVITDLGTIRSGAAKGDTALQTSGGTLTGEIKFNIADLTYEDISAGIIAAFKAFRVQINELICNYIYLGSASQGNSSDSSLVIRKYSSITNKSPSGTTDLVTINTSGNVTAIGGFTGNLTGTATKATKDGNGNVITDTYANKVSVINHETSDTTFTLTPNTFHVWDEVAALDLSFGDETAGVANEFLFQFTSGSIPTTLTLPSSIKWANGNVPTIVADKIYQISVLKGLSSVLEFDNVKIITFTINSVEYQSEDGMTWVEWVNSSYNTDEYRIDGTYVRPNTSVMTAVGNINISDMIISGYVYSLIQVGGGAD